ncbi:hypothetical protein [Piscirickettsia litoralis]|uniref:Transposase n=1 Tax=Piscirickettsia litoralis TaxID=1891921 RepID=A0ABX3A161_9GAMM|nr:hypothetical protein [Piscirickettsia litoralis]ODN42369.1 hypothetical protein BGC07_04760 [Piscirickettsia litoralis]
MTYIADFPDATLKDYRDQLESDTGKSVTIPCMHYVIKELKVSYKKILLRTRTGARGYKARARKLYRVYAKY